MPTSPGTERFDLVLRAAADLAGVDCAYHAELLVSTLLGSVYAVAEQDRVNAVADFAEGLHRYLAGRRQPEEAVLLRAVLPMFGRQQASEQPNPGAQPKPGAQRKAAGRPEARSDAPLWTGLVGAVHLTGAYANADEYGDQTSYVATFGYDDESAGGPEHAVVALVDHNLGFVRDLVVTTRWDAAGAGSLVPVEPTRLREEVEQYLAATDGLQVLPRDDSFAADRALAGARLRVLPEPGSGSENQAEGQAEGSDGGPDEGSEEGGDVDLLAEFRKAPEARRLGRIPRHELSFCLDLILEYAASRPDRDPLRWSPAAVDLFLLDWVPRRAVLDADDITALPSVLSAWTRWSGRVQGLSPKAVAGTVVAIAGFRDEFAERAGSGTHRSEATQAVAQLLAEGVDLSDEAAVAAWIEDYNTRASRS
jgi:hypothetical protein